MEAGAKANSAVCVLVSTEDAENLGERQRRAAKGDKDYRKHLMGGERFRKHCLSSLSKRLKSLD